MLHSGPCLRSICRLPLADLPLAKAVVMLGTVFGGLLAVGGAGRVYRGGKDPPGEGRGREVGSYPAQMLNICPCVCVQCVTCDMC